MQLVLDETEREVASAAASFLAGEYPLERLHSGQDDSARWAEFAELGWLGLAAAESVGGSGLGPIEQMLFFLEMGRVAGPVGVLPQVLAVAATIDNAEQCQRFINGEHTAALVVTTEADGNLRLVGQPDASHALSVTPDSATLSALDLVTCRRIPCLDRSAAMYLGEPQDMNAIVEFQGDAVWRVAQLAVAAMLTGTAERALDMIVGYAKERHTFGRPIGAYQAVRHPCADMAVRVEAARCQLYYAATALAEGHEDAAMQLDATMLLAERAARANTDANIQLHGGIGVTDEFSAQLLLKRANLLWRLPGCGRGNRRSLLSLDNGAAA